MDFKDHEARMHKMRAYINTDKTYWQNLYALREYYDLNHAEIMAHHESGGISLYRAYPCDWSRILTPIEFAAWITIRAKGRLSLYPQYPVAKYYLDFGNPYLKIGLELDGKAYHDPTRDKERDINLAVMGWKIFRITGKEMMNIQFPDLCDLYHDRYTYDNDFDKMRNWLMNSGDGIIEAIKYRYFGGHMPYIPHEYYGLWDGLVTETLMRHNLLRTI